MTSSPRQDKRRNYNLPSNDFLPLFDTLFAVAFTLLAYSVPEMLKEGLGGVGELALAIATFLLNGTVVLLYWFKLRRLIAIARVLHPPQLLLGFISILTIVVLPRLSALALYYGGGHGDLSTWTSSQLVNMVFLGSLFLFDGFCLLFALSLRWHRPRSPHTATELTIALQAQTLGFLVLLVMAAMELVFIWFNDEYVLLVPLVLLVEELWVARRFADQRSRRRS